MLKKALSFAFLLKLFYVFEKQVTEREIAFIPFTHLHVASSARLGHTEAGAWNTIWFSHIGIKILSTQALILVLIWIQERAARAQSTSPLWSAGISALPAMPQCRALMKAVLPAVIIIMWSALSHCQQRETPMWQI